MVEINGKFKTWLKQNGYGNQTSKKTVLETFPMESLDGKSCVEIILCMESLIERHGGDVVYNERWTGYEEFYPEAVVWRQETDDEYEKRIKELRLKYDKEANTIRETIAAKRKEIEDQMKSLQTQLSELKG